MTLSEFVALCATCYHLFVNKLYYKYLFTGTEKSSVFCGPKIVTTMVCGVDNNNDV